MAQTNFSEESLKKLQELYNYCSAELVGGIHNQRLVLSGINVLFSITAFVGNSLTLVALHKESSLYPPSKHLLRSLATTDLCVGFVVEPLEVTFWMSLVYERWGICRFVLTVDTVASFFAVFSVFIYADCNKPGQTPCPHSAAQIQTDCNFEAKFYSCKCTLVCVYFCCNDVRLESFYS